jgi:hypothetical protein
VAEIVRDANIELEFGDNFHESNVNSVWVCNVTVSRPHMMKLLTSFLESIYFI